MARGLIGRGFEEGIAFTAASALHQEDAFARLVADADVNAVVLAGGDGIFCAGFDLKEGMESGGKSFLHRFAEFFEACYLFPKPMVAAVDGLALAGGFDLALTAGTILIILPAGTVV